MKAHLRLLADSGFPLDLQANPRHLPFILELLRELPHLRAVIDHLAKPPIDEGIMEPWRTHMIRIAAYPGVMCKLSGMVPEKHDGAWSAAAIRPYAQAAFAAFGAGRILFGSDWPVCLYSASYDEVAGLFRACLPERLAETDHEAIYGGNAVKFYRLAERQPETYRTV